MANFLKKLFLVLVGDRFKSQLGEDNEFRKFSDEELVRLIVLKNNTLLFSILYDRYANKIYNKCSGFARSDAEALDLTQDVLLNVFVKLGSFKEKSKFSSWVYSLTYNFCVNYVNRNKARKIKDKSVPIEQQEDKLAEKIEDKKLFKLRSEKLKNALNLIDPEDKTILLLKYQDDVSIKELGVLLEIGESAVKMRLKRARARIVETYNSM
ncbi:MAG: RNA polymerase sigma factor [Flavobacteriaceae bacterium]